MGRKKKADTSKAASDKKELKKHLCDQGMFRGVLSRNTTYRLDAWDGLKSEGTYSHCGVIKAAIVRQDTAQGRPDGKYKNGSLINGMTQAERARTYTIDYDNPNLGPNFKIGRIPYRNQAHHIVACEIFYGDEWDAEHLNVVLQCGYDINNPDNIIYLPQCSGSTHYCDYHLLPDHSKDHGKYNNNVKKSCKPIYNMVDKAVNEKDCEKAEDLRKQIFDKLKEIEGDYWDRLIAAGGKPIGEA